MLYLNQLDYPDIPYVHRTEQPDGPVVSSVRKSGCGLCCSCMMVEHLTMHTLPIADCVEMAEDNQANKSAGSSQKVLGPVLAEKFGLEFSQSYEIEDALQCLREGGEVIINVGGDHDDHIGIYSHGGHYVLAIGYDGEELCILDPSYKEDKYEEEGRQGKVKVDYPFTYCTPDVIVSDTRNRNPCFSMYKRKKYHE